MIEMLYAIAATVAVLNIFFLIFPDGKYEKYVKLTMGLVVIMTIARVFPGISVSSDVLKSDYHTGQYDTAELESVMKEQAEAVAAESIEAEVSEHFGDCFSISDVQIENNGVKSVTAEIYDKTKAEALADAISEYCNVDKNKIILRWQSEE